MKKKETISIDQAELAVRQHEALTGLKRPEGYSAVEALSALHPETRDALLRCARAAVDYLLEGLRETGADVQITERQNFAGRTH